MGVDDFGGRDVDVVSDVLAVRRTDTGAEQEETLIADWSWREQLPVLLEVRALIRAQSVRERKLRWVRWACEKDREWDAVNPASSAGGALPAADDGAPEDPQWFVAVAYGLHAAGRANGYTAAARVANEARRGINLWWAGSEPRGAVKASGVPTIDVIFDR